MNQPTKPFLSVEEAARLLNVSKLTLYRHCSGKGFQKERPPHFRVGGQIRFDKDALLAWFQQGGELDEKPVNPSSTPVNRPLR